MVMNGVSKLIKKILEVQEGRCDLCYLRDFIEYREVPMKKTYYRYNTYDNRPEKSIEEVSMFRGNMCYACLEKEQRRMDNEYEIFA